jgi:hypothetical protein
MKTRTRTAQTLPQPRSSHHGNDQPRSKEAAIIESCSSSTWSSTQSASSKAQSKIRLKIMQHQAGHSYASTTAIYTGVSDEFRNRLLVAALRERHARAWEDES